MLRMILSRLFYAAVILVAVTFVVSLMVKLVPGDPVDLIVSANPGMGAEDAERLREQMGLTRPVFEQFLNYLHGAVRGDLGQSIWQKLPVTQMVADRLPATVELAFWAMIIGLGFAIPLGILTALNRGKLIDYIGSIVAVLGVSMPGFLFAILMILWFSVQLRWLPSSGYRGSAIMAFGRAIAERDFNIFWNSARYFILPSISLAVVLIAVNMRLLRSSMLEILDQDFITFAQAKGVPPFVVIMKHAFRNALLPLITIIALQLGALLSSAVVVETVFAWPGIGRMAVDAISTRDYPVVQAIVLISAALFVGLNLIVDILYRFVDPRVRDD